MVSVNRTAWLGAILVLPLFLAAACGGSDDEPSAPAATSTPAAATEVGTTAVESTATPAPQSTVPPLPSVSPVVGSSEPDGERILETVKVLADTIGPRVAGTDDEKIAAGLIADWLRELGYDVALQEFAIGTEIGRSSSFSVEAPDTRTLPTLPFTNSGIGEVTASLVPAGSGGEDEFPENAQGAVVLIQRDGETFFSEMVANAEEAGAAGVVIYNNEQGILYGSLSTRARIPVVGISKAEGEELLDTLDGGPVTASLSVGEISDATSFNVIATPPDEKCETVTGGHYDSVQAAPGASDNASGTATVLEIAAVLAHNGDMGSNCFVLFGAEELGLLGSAYYVSQLSDEELGSLRAMLNLDMVGFGEEGWWLIGDEELQSTTIALAGDLGIEGAAAGELVRGLGSDHASFHEAGVPALMFHRWEDTLLHTPQDVSGRINPQYLEEAAEMGLALLESLAGEG